MIHRRTFVSLAAATAVAPVLPAFAQQPWPTHFVRVIVPFTPGGGIDAIGRVVGARLSEMWGQQVIVENKPGAGGNIASELVARADPDGHTLYISAAGIAVNQFLFPSINYDPVNDFAPVSLLCFFPNLLVVPPSSPFKSAADIVAYAKANPGKLNFGSSGVGSGGHLATELFKHMAGIDIVHVPYKGVSAATTDVLGGQIGMLLGGVSVLKTHADGGRLRGLAVSTIKRTSIAPDIPTIDEAGVKGYATTTWYGALAPANTRPTVVQKLNAEIKKTLGAPEVGEHMAKDGAEPVGNTPAQFREVLTAEVTRYRNIARENGITLAE